MKLLSNKRRQIAAPCQCCTKCPAQTQSGRGIKWGEYWEDFVLTQRSHILHRQFMCYVLPPLWYFPRNSILQVRPQKFFERQSSGDSRERRRQGQTGDTLVTSIKAPATNSTQTKVGAKGNQLNHVLTLGTLGGAFFLSNSLVFIEGGKIGLKIHHADCPLSPDEFVPIIAAGFKHTHLRWDGETDLAENSFPRPFSLGYFPSGSVLLICSSTSYGSSCGSMKQGMTQGTYEQLWVGLMVA